MFLGPLPVATLFEMDWRHTPETIAAIVSEARPLIRQVWLFERALPMSSWGVGAALVVIGALFGTRIGKGRGTHRAGS